MRPFTVLYHTFSYIARQKMRKKINGVFTKKAHSVYAKITKRNSNRRRKKYFKTQKSSQNDVVRLYFTFFSHIPLALSVKKCYTYKKIIYNILYNRIVLFRRHSSSAERKSVNPTERSYPAPESAEPIISGITVARQRSSIWQSTVYLQRSLFSASAAS